MFAKPGTQKNNGMAAGQILKLTIEKLLYGGDGISRHGGMVCLIKDVVPEEIVLARIDVLKKQYAVASLVEVLEPSPYRVSPRCSLFENCGGCQWQHIAYSHQLYWKTRIVQECLERIGKIQQPTLLPTIPSPAAFQYRCRARLKVCNKKARIGYYQRGTHYIVPVQECPLLVNAINQAIRQCWLLIKIDRHLFNSISEVDLLFCSNSNQVIMAFNNMRTTKCLAVFDAGTSTQPGQIKFSSSFPAIEEILDEEILGIVFKRRPSTFYQVNRPQNNTLITIVRECFGPIDNQTILDLYCGSGNFSLFLAREGATVVGIDSNAHAISEALCNAEYNGLGNCTYVCGDVETAINQHIRVNFSGVLINPPRSGCSMKTLNSVARINPQVIVYVSCNPATLARDLKQLARYGYRLEKIQPVDMFPQTYHIETIVKMVQ